jgi:hypothetical protein
MAVQKRKKGVKMAMRSNFSDSLRASRFPI